MEQALYQNYLQILKLELVPALGCTEPIAIAYAAAKAASVLDATPDSIQVRCSGNIIKNVKGVTVPNSGGLRGIAVAATLGAIGGNAAAELEVLEHVTPEQIEQTKKLVGAGFCSCTLAEGVANLYIAAKVKRGEHWAEVTIINRHTYITKIVKDGQVLFSRETANTQDEPQVDKSLMTLDGILEFARTVQIKDVAELLQRQIDLNSKIAAEGLTHAYGAQVGQTLLQLYGDDVKTRARAKAAAGSDARMGGCSLPVVINSGSGNQGMTVSLPVIEYARHLQVSQETLYRALVLSNLISIHQKKFIGSLSAYCGAVTAAAGAGAAITYLCGGDDKQIGLTIVNTIANVGGIVCDGAKASCAAKIASAVEAALLANALSMQHRAFLPGEGIVQKDVETTIKGMGYIGRVGMQKTDTEILKIMIDEVEL
ncbi:MAG: L-serine ammonia-lyase, iron-sulfur-dependent, subunit alpha [Acidaminococcaceae bacterium]|jgi:L-cysteine desulfidase|nr:L-serine ammonia-lyase, iron-sulfur-dependent, subunit alpha [Acidaminococcaceae bacterium]